MVQPKKPVAWSAVLSGRAAVVVVLGPLPRREAAGAANPGRG